MAIRKKKNVETVKTSSDELFDSIGYTAGSVKEVETVKKPTPIAKREKKEMKVFKPVVKETTVVKGNHLTVTTFPDGRTELEWDDDALLKEVREAIASAELADMKPAVRAKAATRKKKEKTNGQ